MKRIFRQTRDAQSLAIKVSTPDGSYRPAKRDLILETWMVREPGTVTEQSGNGTTGVETLPRLEAADLARLPKGWSYSDGLLTVKDNDRFEPVRFTIQN